MTRRTTLPGALGAVGSALGLVFSAFSTHDYAQHLDRQLHATNCSFIPGLAAAEAGENACTVAMYSAYSALFRDRYWGGVPISLFALGAYAVFAGFAVYLLVGRSSASARFFRGYGVATALPLLASAVMATISATALGGSFCKLCVGLYVASAVLATSGVLAYRQAGGAVAAKAPPPPAPSGPDLDATERDPAPWGAVVAKAEGASVGAVTVDVGAQGGVTWAPAGARWVPLAVLALLGLGAAAPALVYVASLPKIDAYLTSCGALIEPEEKTGALVKIATTSPVQAALTFEDPLCPTCRAFHQRLAAEGILEQLDYRVAVFPLDSECNWMLDRPLHPGACTLSKALLCADETGKGRLFLDWAYDSQDELAAAGKAGKEALLAKVRARFPGLDACVDDKKTKQRLDAALRFAVKNKIRVSTPQLFLGGQRVCDEDTDLGLRYTFRKLAPGVK